MCIEKILTHEKWCECVCCAVCGYAKRGIALKKQQQKIWIKACVFLAKVNVCMMRKRKSVAACVNFAVCRCRRRRRRRQRWHWQYLEASALLRNKFATIILYLTYWHKVFLSILSTPQCSTTAVTIIIIINASRYAVHHCHRRSRRRRRRHQATINLNTTFTNV